MITGRISNLHDKNGEAAYPVTIVKAVYMNDGNTTLEKKINHIDEQFITVAKKEDVARISTGTPLFASSTTEMTDITRNYVNTTDGYLYVFSNGKWNKTIQYQSTGIEKNSIDNILIKNKSVTEQNISFIDGEATENIFNYKNIESGYCDIATKQLKQLEGLFTTDFIEIGTSLNFRKNQVTGGAEVSLWDANKNILFVYNCGFATGDYSNIDLTEHLKTYVDACYIRFTVDTRIGRGMEDIKQMMIVRGTNPPKKFVEYKIKSEQLNITSENIGSKEIKNSHLDTNILNAISTVRDENLIFTKGGFWHRTKNDLYANSDFYYTSIDVKEGEKFIISGTSIGDSFLYGIRNNQGVLIENYPSEKVSTSTNYKNIIIEIPKDGTTLLINKYLTNKVKLEKIVTKSLNYEASPRPVILDTDWWTDSDDAVSIRIMNWAEQQGMIDVVGICLDVIRDTSVKSLSTFLDYEGRSGLCIGADKQATDYDGVPSYHQPMINAWGYYDYSSVDEVEDCVDFYRRALTSIPENEQINIICIGYGNALSRLLNSSADKYSDLNGKELVKKKVRHLWFMAGQYLTSDGGLTYKGSENNFTRTTRSRQAGKNICDNWPTPITFLGWEVSNTVRTGGTIGSVLGTSDLIYIALNAHGGSDETTNGRSSWDPMTMMLACINDDNASGYKYVYGTNSVDETTGNNTFTVNTNGNHRFVVKKYPDNWYKHQINSILEKRAWKYRKLGRVQLPKI